MDSIYGINCNVAEWLPDKSRWCLIEQVCKDLKGFELYKDARVISVFQHRLQQYDVIVSYVLLSISTHTIKQMHLRGYFRFIDATTVDIHPN